jgi:Protein of unknown function (DUF3433)
LGAQSITYNSLELRQRDPALQTWASGSLQPCRRNRLLGDLSTWDGFTLITTRSIHRVSLDPWTLTDRFFAMMGHGQPQSEVVLQGSSSVTLEDDGGISEPNQSTSARISDSAASAEPGLKSKEPYLDIPTSNATLPEAMAAEDHRRMLFNGRTRCQVSEIALGSDDILRPIPVPRGYPKLDYKPVMLRSGCMAILLAFYVVVFGLLIGLIFVKSISFSSQYGYFMIQILPPLLGTITASLWRSIMITLSRIWPYIASASGDSSATKRMDSARRTILARCFPVPEIYDMIRNGNGLLMMTWILWILSTFVLAFKAVLLNTIDWDDYWEANVTAWALYSLLSIYGLLIVGLAALIYCLWELPTGLRWDPVSIADHLVLFHHSNFLAEFEGMETSSRDRLHERFRSGRFRLGYWQRGSLGVWHGFGKIENGLHGVTLTQLSPLISEFAEVSLESIPKHGSNSKSASIVQVDQTPQLVSEFGNDRAGTQVTGECSYRSSTTYFIW